MFDLYRLQHVCAPLLTTQILSSWPDLPTLSFMACAQPCLYINDQYFDSQALSLTWFPINVLESSPVWPPLYLSKRRVVFSSTRDFYLSEYSPLQVQLSTSRTIKACWALTPWLDSLTMYALPVHNLTLMCPRYNDSIGASVNKINHQDQCPLLRSLTASTIQPCACLLSSGVQCFWIHCSFMFGCSTDHIEYIVSQKVNLKWPIVTYQEKTHISASCMTAKGIHESSLCQHQYIQRGMVAILWAFPSFG